MKEQIISEIKAIIILATGMILLASLISFVPEDLSWYTSSPNFPPQNLIRSTGAYLAGSLLFVFGFSSYAIVIFLFFWSWNKFTMREIAFSYRKFFYSLLLLCVISAFFSLIGQQEKILRFERAGMIGIMTSDFLLKYLGKTGTYIILCALGTLTLILTGEFLISPIVLEIATGIKALLLKFKEGSATKDVKASKAKPQINIAGASRGKDLLNLFKAKQKGNKKVKDKADEEADDEDYDFIYDEDDNGPDIGQGKGKKPKDPKIKIAPTKTETDYQEKEDYPKLEGVYHLPSLDLLDNPPEVATSKLQEDLISEAKLLEETLAQFGVNARVADIERGPAITRYELEPAPGVKVNQFTSLSDDIALAMRAAVVRVVAPIPGKNRVGIEVPNQGAATVYLKDVLAGNDFRSSKSKLTLCLGKDIAGKSMIADLASMPHLLIAGTTGSGKTVCVNGIIMSMLMNASPDEVKFVLVDPKMVEMAQYNDIPHLLCPTVTDIKKASNVLNWVVGEMESRYKKLSKEGVRNIKTYNAKGHSMPYIVVVIDELADLMQISAKTVESSITRLAQLSRAVGIHLILATQRPSVDVITGVIKANFPARISFKVASKVDSRTVLDMNGAESLLGRGDMLFIQPGDAKPTRGQCSFVKDEEINRVIQFIKDQQAPIYNEEILSQQKSGGFDGSVQKDEYYDEAVRLVIETNQASVSILQRRMRLGYTRAARLIDMMEQNGIVGPYCGSKPRDLLVDREQWLLDNMKDNESGAE